MNDFFVIFLIVVLVVAIFAGMFVVASDIAVNQCEALAKDANITTSYISSSCHIDVCGSWVHKSDLAYHINAIKACP